MNNMLHFTFHKLLHTLLKQYSKKDIFLRTNKNLKHPHKEIEYIKKNKEFLIEIMISFMGLQGNTSQLPSYMLDKLSRNEDGDSGWTLLFDFFNNHILWLFFESLNLRYYARSFKKDFSDPISKILFSILGISDSTIAERYLPFAHLLLIPSCPKPYVERALRSIFDLHNKLYIIENLPHQILVAFSQKNKLGEKNNTLGKNFILGNTFISYHSKIGIYIKDIEYHRAIEFLPNHNKHNELKESILFLTNHQFCFDLYLRINHNEKMKLILGDKSVAKLGWGSILGNSKKEYHLMHIKMYE